jgi:glycosyltransferase involved in cell wall biosynthesis
MYFIGLTALPVLVSVVTLGFFGSYFVPILYGHKTDAVLAFLPLYVSMVAIFTVAQPIIYYLQAKKNYVVAAVGIVVTLLQVGLTYKFVNDIWTFLEIMFVLSLVNLTLSLVILFLDKYRWVTKNNFKDLQQLIFLPIKTYNYPETNKARILILNWRDSKHRWSGGAETYVHQLAKKWVEMGHQVTIFSGNDGHCQRHEMIDGIKIIRRGGTYTVYIWAFLYYVIRLRGVFDVVVDSENGIPFFTPLYVRKPKFLLIHHIHQEVFREHLKFPLAQIGMFLEAILMPIVYRNSEIVTVSESSKKQIIKLGLGSIETISVVHPGVNLKDYSHSKKTNYPSLLYLGRLKSYKNIDSIIHAFEKILKYYPSAILNIVGQGEQRDDLEKMVKKLGLEDKIFFCGKVDETEKIKLLGMSWVLLQPSMVEGWGITVIEANACGTPVIASDVFGLRDSVSKNQTGKLIEPRNIEQWVSTILEILSDHRQRKKLSLNAYKWSQKYDWNLSAEKLLNLLNQSIKKTTVIRLSDRVINRNTELVS